MPDHDDRPLLRIAHSPDPDDAFMWWPLLVRDGEPPRIDTGGFRFEAVQDDIEVLNHRAEAAELEITAMSCAQYPYVQDRYAITACGASMGDRYGPKLVAGRPMPLEELRRPDVVIAVPGERTSAFAVSSLILGPGSFRYEVVPFDEIIPRVAGGDFAAGLVIHEGQLTYETAGLHLIQDVGVWWWEHHRTPLPLGVNTVRRDLTSLYGHEALGQIAATLRCSVEYALAHREESVAIALSYARGMEAALADEFISLYVNQWTLDFGAEGRGAVRTFLGALHRAGLTPAACEIDFVGGASSSVK